MKRQYKRIESLFHTNQQRNCTHPDEAVQVAFEGGYHFSAGDVYDDVRETLVCTRCGCEVELMDEAQATEMEAYISHDWGMAF